MVNEWIVKQLNSYNNRNVIKKGELDVMWSAEVNLKFIETAGKKKQNKTKTAPIGKRECGLQKFSCEKI